MKKLIDIYITYQKLSFQKMFFYRFSTYTQFFSLFIWVIIDLIFFRSIFSNTGKFSGWNYWDSVLLILSLSLFWDIFWRITSAGIVYLPEKIFNGDLNKYLLKPINPLYNLAVSEVGSTDSSINTPIIFIYYILNNGFYFSITQVLGFIVMVILGVGIFTWILLIIVSLSFWVTNVEYLSQIYWELQNIARYPKDIFRGFLANMFMFVIPVFFIANTPADILRNGFNVINFAVGIVLNLVLFILSIRLWNKGLKEYKSVSI